MELCFTYFQLSVKKIYRTFYAKQNQDWIQDETAEKRRMKRRKIGV